MKSLAVLFGIHFLAGGLFGVCGRVGVLLYVIAFVLVEAVIFGIMRGTVLGSILLFLGLAAVVEVGYLIGSAIYLYITDNRRPSGSQVDEGSRHLNRSKNRLFSFF